MTQVIACCTPEGIVLATDSRATWFDPAAGMKHFHLKKLLRLGSHAAIVSAGAGIGVEMGAAFQQFIQRRNVEGIEEMTQLALPFFTDRYGQYVRERRMEGLPSPEETDRQEEESFPLSGVYFVLAGYSFRDRHQPYHLRLFGCDEEGMPMRCHPPSQIIVIPRSLSMEKRLDTELQRGAPLDDLSSLCLSFLKKRSAEEEVGPPFHIAAITPAGFKEMIKGEVER
jgi:hypothetical protein